MRDKTIRDNLSEQILVLLVGLEPEECAALACELEDREPRARLLSLAALGDAWPYLETQQADVLVCDLATFIALQDSLAEHSGGTIGVPILVLVPPGGEEAAAARLDDEFAQFILQSGNYLALLPAIVRRAWRRQQISWEDVTRILRHEINNPLTGILGNAELILAEAASMPERVRSRLTTIIDLTVRLRDLVRNLEERLRGRNDTAKGTPPPAPLKPVGLTREV